MAEYIEREAAIEAVMCEPPDAHYPQWYADKIKEIPSADAAQVRRGKWVEWFPGDCALIMTGEEMLYRCSSCDAKYSDADGYKYCPNCGAVVEDVDA